MAAESQVWAWFTILVLSGCAGAARSPGATTCDVADRFPIRPCASATQPSRVGVWQDTTSSYALVFDGCYVSFEYTGAREHEPDADLRSLAGGALVVEWREFGDPPPYFRAHARWQGDLLLSASIIGERPVARWDGTAMRGLWRGAGPLTRVSTVSALRRQARRLLCVESRHAHRGGAGSRARHPVVRRIGPLPADADAASPPRGGRATGPRARACRRCPAGSDRRGSKRMNAVGAHGSRFARIRRRSASMESDLRCAHDPAPVSGGAPAGDPRRAHSPMVPTAYRLARRSVILFWLALSGQDGLGTMEDS